MRVCACKIPRINTSYINEKYIVQESAAPPGDTVAEWSKAPGSGPGSKERGFKSHRCQHTSASRLVTEDTRGNFLAPPRPVR